MCIARRGFGLSPFPFVYKIASISPYNMRCMTPMMIGSMMNPTVRAMNPTTLPRGRTRSSGLLAAYLAVIGGFIRMAPLIAIYP